MPGHLIDEAMKLGARRLCPWDWAKSPQLVSFDTLGKSGRYGHRYIEEGFDGYCVAGWDEPFLPEEKTDD